MTLLLLLQFLFAVVALGARDWLIDEITDEVAFVPGEDSTHHVLSNGLITREFVSKPNWGTINYRSDSASRSILRTIAPEAFITLDGYEYAIGGLSALSPVSDYLNRSSLVLQADPNAFQYVSNLYHSSTTSTFHWEPGLRNSPKNVNWPPKGKHIQADFKAPSNVKVPEHANVMVSLHYEMYVGVPIMSKWMTIQYANTSESMPIVVNSVVVENLPVDKPYVPWDYDPINNPWQIGSGMTSSWLYVETDESHVSKVSWVADPKAVAGAVDISLVCTYYDGGPGIKMADVKGNRIYLTTFDSFRVIELITDTDDRERVALSRHRLTRLLNPQTQESPIFFHSTNNTPAGFEHGIKQMVEVGFEMYIYSFGSGFNMETYDITYLNQIRDNIKYAKSKGIEVGG
jgi:hypothetical protein